jgi:hypothetical protein
MVVMARQVIRRVNDRNRTTAVFHDKPEDWFVPDWDKEPGARQQLKRVRDRADMGIKITPKGAGKLKPPL